jgi:N-acetyl-anhydromuramyl-L-alanine amidase AmpD
MRLGTCGVFLAAMFLVGCAQPTYTVLTDLPPPPRSLGPTVPNLASTQAAAKSQPADPQTRPDPPGDPAVGDGWVPPVREQRWRYIVVHHSGSERGSAASFDTMHRTVRGWDELGYHFVIDNGDGGPDGSIEVGSRWVKQKWGAHCGGTPNNEYNDFGIGICLVGNFDVTRPTERQMQALAQIVRYMMDRYRIPRSQIYGHGQLKPTDCPGRYFDYTDLWRRL